MKVIEVTFDEKLLADLDATEEVRREGRSAVLRRATERYLRARRQKEIAERYRRAYGQDPGVDEELQGWAAESAWPAR
ncbi:MAG: hypothetical protein ACLF0P_05070 [Thermoanaerobaculia bacterium]